MQERAKSNIEKRHKAQGEQENRGGREQNQQHRRERMQDEETGEGEKKAERAERKSEKTNGAMKRKRERAQAKVFGKCFVWWIFDTCFCVFPANSKK